MKKNIKTATRQWDVIFYDYLSKCSSDRNENIVALSPRDALNIYFLKLGMRTIEVSIKSDSTLKITKDNSISFCLRDNRAGWEVSLKRVPPLL